uniref:DapH/DapD/GlmU-related protein n=1 Tax=Prevotella sp. GTC17254 TaxID=3236794 RepID=A0AB33J3D9_9BACT
MLVAVYKIVRKICLTIQCAIEKTRTVFSFLGNGVEFHSFKTSGIPYVMVARGGKLVIGDNFSMNNGLKSNPIGCSDRCILFVDKGAELIIGRNVGISQTALVALDRLEIQDNVKIGGGSRIYTSDFHSINPLIRKSSHDMEHRKNAPVVIKENAFIGAGCLILKGVTIGENSIVGAGSVVTKSIPDNEIWGGNPARLIRKIIYEKDSSITYRS